MPPSSTPESHTAPSADARRSRLVRWGGALVWAVVIFSMSALPGSNVPGRFGSLAHFVEYAIFAALLYLALRVDVTRTRAALLAVLIASAYAVTDEYHQSFVPMRVPDPADWAVDTLGAAVGVLGMAWLESALAKRRAGSD